MSLITPIIYTMYNTMSREIGKKCRYFAIILWPQVYIIIVSEENSIKKAPSLGLKLASDRLLAPYLRDGVGLRSQPADLVPAPQVQHAFGRT